MNERSPYDGQPYYCTFCGMGLGEYYACEDVRCVLESDEKAQARAALAKARGETPDPATGAA